MVAVSRYATGSSLLVLSLLIGCDHTVVDPSPALFRVADAPAYASADAASDSRIDVSWPDNLSNETGFEVHRSATGPGGAFTLVATTGRNITRYSDQGLMAETQYCYEVRSFRRTGKETSYSTFTAAACATTFQLPAPSAASAVAVSETRIDVAWQDNSTSESGFEVHRSATGLSGTFALLASAGAGVTSYSDVGLTSSTQYCYKVRASQANGGSTKYSEFSAAVCATTLTPPPTAPPAAPGPLAPSVFPWRIELWWSDNAQEGANREDGFKVERCEAAACGDADFTVLAVHLRGSFEWNWYIDYAVQPGTTYTYRVRAFNAAGESAPSNAASATACFVETDWEGGGYYICVYP